jgi:hypothetical protein
MDKRGQELSTNAIILIVLGVIILVILILGFTIGWDKFAPWLKPKNNVNSIVQACSLACTTSNQYDFCTNLRELKAEDLPVDAEGKEVKSVKQTCKFFATDAGYASYAITDCPDIECVI